MVEADLALSTRLAPAQEKTANPESCGTEAGSASPIAETVVPGTYKLQDRTFVECANVVVSSAEGPESSFSSEEGDRTPWPGGCPPIGANRNKHEMDAAWYRTCRVKLAGPNQGRHR
jgi:hypothetical protein